MIIMILIGPEHQMVQSPIVFVKITIICIDYYSWWVIKETPNIMESPLADVKPTRGLSVGS